MITLKLKNYEDETQFEILENIKEALNNALKNASSYVENDGIGGFECWGFVGYDSGANYPVIEMNPIDIEFSCKNEKDPEILKEILAKYLDDYSIRDEYLNDFHCTLKLYIDVKPHSKKETWKNIFKPASTIFSIWYEIENSTFEESYPF